MRNDELSQLLAIEKLLEYCHIKTYPSKKRVCWVGDPNTTLFLILEGTVSVGVEDYENGHGLVYGYLHKGDCIGAISVFQVSSPAFHEKLNNEKLKVDVITLSCCKLAEITYIRLWQLMKKELALYAIDILLHIGQQVAARLQSTQRGIQFLVTMNAEERIYQILLNLSEGSEAIKHQEGMQIRITRQELGRIAGCSPEVAGRMLKSLDNKNKIQLDGKRRSILVLDGSPTLSEAVEKTPRQ
jgi:CRP/FNR family transcriptional regulator, cyclic AMP receptor protein